MELYPLLCEPHCQPRVWGGTGLAERFGKPLPPGEPIGETWEVADLPEGVSTIGNGSYRGRTLGELTREFGATLIGTAWPPGRFPLLVKLLDARQDLSVQVHPADDDCRDELVAHHGKDECWIILFAEPGGAVIHGVRAGTCWDDVAAAAEDGTIFDHLRRLEVRSGDVVHVSPGTIHALLAGVMVLEIQQPSDSTFRLYDYGRGRPLHLAEAQRVARLEALDPCPECRTESFAWGRHECLIDVAAYRIERLTVDREAHWSVDPRTAQVLVVIEGSGTVAGGGVEVPLSAGRTVLLPARLGPVRFTPDGAATLVLAGAGGTRLGPGESG